MEYILGLAHAKPESKTRLDCLYDKRSLNPWIKMSLVTIPALFFWCYAAGIVKLRKNVECS